MTRSTPIPPPVQSIEFDWYVADKRGSAAGPYQLNKLAGDAASGNLDGRDLVYHEQATRGEWVAAASVHAIRQAAAPPSPPTVAIRPSATESKQTGRIRAVVPSWMVYVVAAWVTCSAAIAIYCVNWTLSHSQQASSLSFFQEAAGIDSDDLNRGPQMYFLYTPSGQIEVFSFPELIAYSARLALVPIIYLTVLFVIPTAIIRYARK